MPYAVGMDAGASKAQADTATRQRPADKGGSDGDAVASRLEIMEVAIAGSPLMMFGADEELRYRWVQNPQPPWTEEGMIGRTDAELVGDAEAHKVVEAKRRVLESGQSETLELVVQLDRQRYWYEITLKRHEADGQTQLLGCVLDISEKKRREVMLQALLREVSHRSKNLLSVVLSIASQTSRKSFDKHTFLTRFTGRIQSISRSQDSITGSNWRGAALSELIESQVYGNLVGRHPNIAIEGPDLQLTPNAALHIGLALHELTTNALAHGSLMGDRGQVSIVVEAAPEPDAGTPVVVQWSESSTADLVSPREDSFGMMTLKRIVPAAVGGKGSLTFRPDGLVYRLQLGSDECEAMGTPLKRPR